VLIATDTVELTPAYLAYYGEAVVGTYGAQPRTPQETKKLFKDAGIASYFAKLNNGLITYFDLF
jgi:hypothetical protein